MVTKDVPPYALVYGVPAEVHGKVNKEGEYCGRVMDMFELTKIMWGVGFKIISLREFIHSVC